MGIGPKKLMRDRDSALKVGDSRFVGDRDRHRALRMSNGKTKGCGEITAKKGLGQC